MSRGVSEHYESNSVAQVSRGCDIRSLQAGGLDVPKYKKRAVPADRKEQERIMTPKTILAPLSGGGEDRTALLIALTAARRFGAHVDALFVAPDPKDSVLVLGDGLSTLMVDEIMRASESVWSAKVRAARAAFDSVHASAADVELVAGPVPGVRPTLRWRDAVGRVDEIVAAEARLTDLTVFAHPSQLTDLSARQALEAALLFSGRPVLVAPAPPERLGRVVAIAWNGRAEAARAVAAAMPLLVEAEQVYILSAPTADSAEECADKLADALAWRGIRALVRTVSTDTASPAVALTGKVAELGADLLVMGAYGHSRVREMILGGMTRHVLTTPGPAVLFAH